MDPRIRTIRFWLLAALGVVLVAADCDLPLLAAYALSPLGLFMPVFAVGCSPGTCTSAFSSQYQVVVSGFTNADGGCTSCASRNGTWTVTQVTDTSLDLINGNGYCGARAYIHDPCLCVSATAGWGDDEVRASNEIVLITTNGSTDAPNIYVVFRHDVFSVDCHNPSAEGGGQGDIQWIQGGTFDCGHLLSEEVPFNVQLPWFDGCNHDHSSAYVTSL